MEELTVRHIKTIDSACNVLKMITCIPADRMDWDFVSSVLGGAMKLLKIADQEARDILAGKKEAPETAATETDAKEKTIQEDDNTEKSAPSKRQKVTQDMKTEMILMRRDGIPVTKIAEKFGGFDLYGIRIHKLRRPVWNVEYCRSDHRKQKPPSSAFGSRSGSGRGWTHSGETHTKAESN